MSDGSAGEGTPTELPTRQVQINVNLDSLAAELQRAVRRITHLVAWGLQSPVDVSPERLQIDTLGIRIHYNQQAPWEQTKAQQTYQQWVLANGFRDGLEAVSSFRIGPSGVSRLVFR